MEVLLQEMTVSGYEIHKSIQNDIKLTAQDRLYFTRFNALESLDKESYIKGLASLAISVSDNCETHENITSQKRLERMYASLSINIEPYDETRLLSLETVDSILLNVIEYIDSNCDGYYGLDFIDRIRTARRSGLAPTKQDSNPFTDI
ncbi:MAG: hypothetical protein H6793_04295 [Candidatus Nomurabacteria bacterium]|nr:MAG: hypothetical protein H6793_04295 [Candidatus Nomurabacteria bacterium]